MARRSKATPRKSAQLFTSDGMRYKIHPSELLNVDGVVPMPAMHEDLSGAERLRRWEPTSVASAEPLVYVERYSGLSLFLG